MKKIILAVCVIGMFSMVISSCASSRGGCPTNNPNYFRGAR